MADNFKYTAFISYSHTDKVVVEWLHKALEGYKIPKALIGRETTHGKVPEKFKPFFRDRDDLSAATNLSASIKKAMAQSQFLIVVCSPEAAASPWVAKEINEFKKLRDQDHILCLIVGGALTGKNQPFPEALWEGLSALEKKTFEPIAADARPIGDGKKLAKLKLISGMLGVELDSLIQREAKRRQYQISILAGIFTVATLVLSVLLYVATEARKEAEANRLEAEERQFQAEALIEFMLGDLRKNLAPIGSLEIMDTIAIQALGYYASIDPEKMRTGALSRRSEVLLMLGDIQRQRGNSAQAKSAFLEAFNTTEEMLARDPNNPERIFDHSQSVFWLAALDLRQGNFGEAEKQFRIYKEFATRLAGIDPSNLDYQFELGYSYSNLGTLFSQLGNFSEAEEEFQNQLSIFQKLAKNDPDSEDLKYEVAQSFGWLAVSQLGLGKLNLAKDQRLKELEIYYELLALNPQNINIQEDLVVVHQTLGAINSYLGERDLGVLHFEKGIEIGNVLLSFDPENTRPKEILSRLILDYLEILGMEKTLDEMQTFNETTQVLTNFLYDRNTSDTGWALLYYRSQLLNSQIFFRAGKIVEGLEIAKFATAKINDLWTNDQNNSQILSAMGLAAMVLSGGYDLNQQAEKANTTLEIFIQVVEPFEKIMAIRGQDFLTRACLKVGLIAKALQKKDFLEKIGYNAPDFVLFWETWAK